MTQKRSGEILYIYHLDADSPNIQSGRPHSILRWLQREGTKVECVFPLSPTHSADRWMRKVFWHALGRQYLRDRHQGLLRDYATKVQARLAEQEINDETVIFSPSTLPLSYVETDVPITFCADATFAGMNGYYHSYSQLGRSQRQLAERLEQDVLGRAALAVYPSDWAARSAIEHYGVPQERVAVIPFGANFGQDNRREDVLASIEQRDFREFRLLFVGKEWERKGGDCVIQTCAWLRARGVPLRVDFVGGPLPASARGLPFVHEHGLLKPSRLTDQAKLEDLFSQAHLLFVPAQAEAYGIVHCEANAFGLPSLTTDTGGVSTSIRDGINGWKLPVGTPPEVFGERILELYENPDHYREIALSSFEEFKRRLNWGAFCRRYLELVEERIIAPRRAASQETSREVFTINRNSTSSGPKRRLKSRPLRVAYVSIEDSGDIHTWSGLNFHIARCLRKQGIQIKSIGPLTSPRVAVSKVRMAAHRFLRQPRYLWSRHTPLLMDYAAQVSAQLKTVEHDIVFSPGTEPIAYLQSEKPVVIWTDAPFAAMLDYYPWYTGLSPESVREGMNCDRRALEHCALALYSSTWAAEIAVRAHGGLPERVAVLPFGANLETSIDETELAKQTEARLKAPWRFLFVGVEWERKGGDLALATVEELNRRGLPAELIVAGCQPPERVTAERPAYLRLEGFLDKRSTAGRERLAELYRSSLFFFMPSMAEAYGLVFCEANAYGLPCLSTATGGIPTIIENSVNGQLFPLGISATECADWITQNVLGGHYEKLAYGALDAYRERLNWQVAGERIKEHLEHVAEGAASGCLR